MVQHVLKLFTVDKHLIKPIPTRRVKASELVTMEESLKDVSNRTEVGLVANISSGVQYLASWIAGRGAVALHGAMEDMATAEISRAQIWQWLHNQVEFTRSDGSIARLTPDLFDQIYKNATEDLKTKNEVGYATEEIPKAIELFHEMLVSPKLDSFIQDRAYVHLNKEDKRATHKRDMFTPIAFDTKDLVALLPGSRHTGEGLVLNRTKYLRDYFKEPNFSGFPKQFWFAGTSNPLVGTATVLGGGGKVGSYLGGWDANAVNNILNKRLPDTLNVWVNDSSNGAKAINNHLRRDMEIENLEYHEKLAKCKTEAEKAKIRTPFNWLHVPQLVDLEQGWRSIHHIRLAVDSAIDNGINLMHIEDQGHSKRCGHLGDKELAPFDSYCQIMQAANLAATVRLGEAQTQGNGVIFVSRTDALSAKRMEYSEHLADPKHIDHDYIDFEKGLTSDGMYYHLKQGTNPKTGNPYGLDLACARMAEVVNQGLAEYVWMETPNADLHVAKKFIDGVNKILHPKGKHAKMLYNHSPSFDWDLGFVKNCNQLGQGLMQHISSSVAPHFRSVLEQHGEIKPDDYRVALEMIRRYITIHGDPIQRDFDFSEETLVDILLPALDLINTQGDMKSNTDLISALQKSFPGTAVYNAIQKIRSQVEDNTTSNAAAQDRVFHAIADARLGLFGKASGSIGVELPLTTLPDFHYEAFAAHRLSMGLIDRSMLAYVQQVQRPERAHFESQKGTMQPYPYYKHQESTGTGVDARFGLALGQKSKVLEDSTEADDIRARVELESKLKGMASAAGSGKTATMKMSEEPV
jgi:isocitrate lyase